MKSNTAIKLVFALIVLAAAAFGIYKGNELLVLKTEAVRGYELQESQNKNLEFGAQLRGNLQSLSEQKAVIEGSYISSNRLVDFIGELERTATDQSLTIMIEKVEQGDAESLAQGPGQVAPVTFLIQLGGTYEDIETFIRGLSLGQKNLSVSNLSFYKGEGSRYSARLSVSGNILSR